MSQRKQPPHQPPPVQKIRLRYAKRGAARFTSHRDFGRALERALRRAEIPMAYSSGFHPHPRIAYANAAPTSAASEAEFVELGLSERCDVQKIVDALNESLPNGFAIVDAAEARPEALGDLLEASEWEILFPDTEPAILASALSQLLVQESFEVERITKKGARTFDVRAAMLEATSQNNTVRVLLRHTVPLVRPDDIVTALRRFETSLPSIALSTRLNQGPLASGRIGDVLR